jgi:pimeloyl-ACP methyl ester carboxylesterase
MLTRRAALQLGGIAAAGLAAPGWALPDPPVAGLSRSYLPCRFGQLHLRIAEPLPKYRGRPPLLLFHQTPLSGRMFERVMPHLAVSRRVIAVDTPGYGESDRPEQRPDLAGYGDAILDALARRWGGPFDLLGYHTGAAIALDLAARRREVRRLVLLAAPLFDATRRKALVDQLSGAKDPFPTDGSELLRQWQGSLGSRAPGQSMDDVARLVAEKQRGGRYFEWALQSAMEADLAALADQVKNKALVIAPHDGLQAASAEAARRLSAQLIDRPDWKYGLFDADPAGVAALVNPFLDAAGS